MIAVSRAKEAGGTPIVVGSKRRPARGLHRLVRHLRVDSSLGVVFRFFSDPFNLERITPPWLHFEVLNRPPVEMREGLVLDYRLRVRGIGLRWRSVIMAWEPPVRFVDAQAVGPYRWWWHEHRFEPLPDGGTLVTDEVEYATPGGRLVHDLLVRPDLERIFNHRALCLRDLFAAGVDASRGT